MNDKQTNSASRRISVINEKEAEISCWNCFTTFPDNDVESVPLSKIREKERKKFKLYSFLASELSKPKSVSLKQKVSQHYSVGKKLDEKICQNSEVAKYLQDNMETTESTNSQYFPHEVMSSSLQTSTKTIENVLTNNINKADKCTETDINITIIKLTRSDSSSSSSTTPDFRPRRKLLAKPNNTFPKSNDTVFNKSTEKKFKLISNDFVDSEVKSANQTLKSNDLSITQASITEKVILGQSKNSPKSAPRLCELTTPKTPSQKERALLSIEKKSALSTSTEIESPKTTPENTKEKEMTMKQNLKDRFSVEPSDIKNILNTQADTPPDIISPHFNKNVQVSSSNQISKAISPNTLKQILNEHYTIDKKIEKTVSRYANLTKSKPRSFNIESEKPKQHTESLKKNIYVNDSMVTKAPPKKRLLSEKNKNIDKFFPSRSTERITDMSCDTYVFDEDKLLSNENIDNNSFDRQIITSTPKSECQISSKINCDLSDSVTKQIDEIIVKCANLSLSENRKRNFENIKSTANTNEPLKTLTTSDANKIPCQFLTKKLNDHSSICKETNKKLFLSRDCDEHTQLSTEGNKINIENKAKNKSPAITSKFIRPDLNKHRNMSRIPVKVLEKQDKNEGTVISADNVSSYGSESGYAGSSGTVQDIHEIVNEEIVKKTGNKNDTREPSISTSNLKNHQLKSSLPVLNKMFEKKIIKTTTVSKSLNLDINEVGVMSKRWSTLSASSRPLSLQDEVYMSDTLSSGNATLPRRSSSPLPHDRDLDRDRFPINRSGLQARSESMASVYSGAGEGARGSVAVRGEVQFSLLYNYRLGALEVGVKRCRDLAPVDTKRNRSDPYVKVYLLPDKSKAGKRKTKVKKNTLNPVFEETLSFVQPLASLSARTLWLSVWHADMFGRNDFLGEVALPLADVVYDDPAPTWYRLHERTEHFDEQQGTRGDLIIGLKFESQDNSSRGKGTLHVLVKEAKNLVATKPNGLADVFCKSYLLPERGRLAKQKTGVVRRTLNPRWEHTFTYRGLTMQELATRALELSLWDRDRLASNDFMGAIRLSLGTGTYMGASVNWMDSIGKEVALWQTMMQRPNFWVEGSLPLRPQLNN